MSGWTVVMRPRMTWMERGRKNEGMCAALVPGARSVIVVAMNYYTPFVHGTEGTRPRFPVMPGVKTITGDRATAPGALGMDAGRVSRRHGKWYVDTGPVMEKAWAQRAGIGWVGKHTNVITREFGSWVFLGEIITSLELDPDHAGGRSLRDLHAVYRGVSDRGDRGAVRVDSRRCILVLDDRASRRSIPERSGKLDGWIFGCDICQDVCPWNTESGTETSPTRRFSRVKASLRRRLEEWREMTPEEFDYVLAGTRFNAPGMPGTAAKHRARTEPEMSSADPR